MSISTHFVTRLTAAASQATDGNWLEILFDDQFGDTQCLNIYFAHEGVNYANYARAVAQAINTVPIPVARPRAPELEDEVPF